MACAPKIPAYCLHKPSGQAVVKVKGRSIYLGKHGTSESREAYSRVVADLLAGRAVTPPAKAADTPVADTSITIEDLAVQYREHAEGYYRKDGEPTSEVYLVQRAMFFLAERHAVLPATEFAIGDLKAVRESMVASGLSRKTVNAYVARVRAAFKWAAIEGLVPPSVPQALSLLPGLKAGRSDAKENEPVESVSEEIVKATLPHCPEVVADMVRLQLLTGMRPEEVCGFRLADVDRSGDVWVYSLEKHKTQHHGKRRIIHIGPGGQEVLSKYLSRPPEAYCFAPKCYQPIPEIEKRYRRDSYCRAIGRACAKAFPAPDDVNGEELKVWRKVHSWTPNQLRHTAATEIRKRFDAEAAQVVLGHANLSTTEIYAERDLAKAAEVAQAIG